MDENASEHTLEFLLAFDGRTHWYEGGYRVRFEIRRVRKTAARPHGLRYSFTLHDPDGVRLIGFDNAHTVRPRGSRFNRGSDAADHWHRSESDQGRPYQFTDAATLIEDFMNEVERVLAERGIPVNVVADSDERRQR
jgi:hypothetical protein